MANDDWVPTARLRSRGLWRYALRGLARAVLR